MIGLPAALPLLAAVALGAGLAGCGFLAYPAPHRQGGVPSVPATTATSAQVQAAPDSEIVKVGETLYQIARRNNVPIRAVIEANHLEPPYILHPGQPLLIPHPQVHVVTPGETLYGVARRYGVDSSAMVRANGLTPPYKILIGQQLILPSPVVAEPPAPAVASAAEIQHVELLPPQPSGALVATSQLPPPSDSSRAVSVVPLPSQSAVSSSAATQPAPASPRGVTITPLPPPPLASHPEATIQASPDAKVASLSPAESVPPDIGGAVSERFLWPLKGRIVSSYGPKEGGLFNDGINIAARRGQTVVAADDGVVVYAGNEIRGFGNLVLIKHANGWMTAYAHNEMLLVKRGDRVRRSQPIAKAGSSGGVTSPQVHFEIRRGSRAVDPTKYLATLSS